MDASIRGHRALWLCLTACSLLAGCGSKDGSSGAAPFPGGLPLERVSLDGSGFEANGGSHNACVSGDGRYVAFMSHATDWVDGDTNGAADVFVYDAQTGTADRVSLDSSGQQADAASTNPSISDDGRYVVFESSATNLVASDSNGVSDVFLHDRQTGTTQRVSVDSAENQSNGDSLNAAISRNGLFVAFASDATNLVASDLNGVRDIFVRDVAGGTTQRVSVSSALVQGNGASDNPAISLDGRYVAFMSAATNLVAGDTNARYDIFLHDRTPQTTVRVSMSSAGAETNAGSDRPAISADGRYVVFESSATNLVTGDTNDVNDIFLRDTQASTTERISLSSAGTQSDGASSEATVSDDGRYVAFHSLATNLVAGDANGLQDVFLRDRQTPATTRLSADVSGLDADGFSANPTISGNGQHAVFQSIATDLVAGGTNGQTYIYRRGVAAAGAARVSVDSTGGPVEWDCYDAAISADGRCVAFSSQSLLLTGGPFTNFRQIVVRDRQTGTNTMVSLATDGKPGNGNSFHPSLSDDGRYVAFESEATNLVTGDTNGVADVFVHDRQTGTTVRGSVSSAGTQGDGESRRPALSGDGTCVAFSSFATNLVAGDTNGAADVFLRVIATGWTERVSVDSGENQVSGGDSLYPRVSRDGRIVAFQSQATLLVPADASTNSDIFVRDRQAGTTEIASVSTAGTISNGNSLNPDVSGDGRYVVFGSFGNNLVAGDTNGMGDVFLRDRQSATTERINVDSAGSQTNSSSSNPSISDDGKKIVFMAVDGNLVAGDTNGAYDIFARDRTAGTTTMVSANASGTPGDGDSQYPALSRDGRYVVFESAAGNLVSGETNIVRDIFAAPWPSP
jgi:Tol biopolymer transport system component